MDLNYLKKLDVNLKDTEVYPILFLGHGSPMNVIEDNKFSKNWTTLKKEKDH